MSDPAARFCTSCGTGLPSGARFCGHCGAAVPTAETVRQTPESAGERRQASVLFADLCGFTELSRRLDAEEVRALLARFFAAVDAVVRHHGGAIDKHVGDAVMAVFGAPVSHGNDAERAVRAALAMHQAVAELGEAGDRKLAIHVGIASGEVVAGRTGSDLHSEYTVTGPAANLAARLVERAGPGETVIGEGVRAAAARVATLVPLGPATLKGIDAPIPLWRVDAAPPGLSPPAAPLIGREAELAQLTAMVSAAVGGMGQVALLRGDPGIGKTRLLEEVLATAAAHGMRCVRVALLDFGVARGQDAASAIARALAEQAAATDAAHVLALDELLDRARDPAGAVTWDAMTANVRESARRAALAALMIAASATTPLLIAIEDLHWADAETLGRIAALASASRGRPIALLLTTRIDGDPIDRTWRTAAGAAPFTALELAPLDAMAALRLTRAVLPEAGGAAHAWVARAEGNPLFLIELARHASELEATLPDNVQSVVQARIDRLAPADKALIQCASIAGQRVDPALLAVLMERQGIDCTRLLGAGLLRQDGEAFIFAHALILDGVYATLLHARRRELHRRAAAFYAGRDTALEARHLDRAEDPVAPQAYRRAADEAFARGLIADALALAVRGHAIARVPEERAALALVQGESLLELGRAAEAEAAFRAILGYAVAAPDRCRAWIGVAAALRVLSRVDEALAALAEADAARAADPTLVVAAARTHHLRGNLFFARGDAESCAAEHQAALTLARAAGSIEFELRALNGLGDAAYAAGRMRTALDSFERSSAMCRTHGFGRFDQSNRFMIGHCLLYRNEPTRALAVLREAVLDAVRVGGLLMQMVNRESVGVMLVEIGSYAEAVAELDHAFTLSRELGSRRYDALILAWKALALMRLGHAEAAHGAAREAVTSAEQTGQGFAGALVLGALAEVSGDDAEARDALAKGEQLLARGCISHNHFWFYRSAMEVSRRAGRPEDALRYAAALEIFTAPEPLPWSTFHIRCTRALIAARGARDPAVFAELAALRTEATRAGLAAALPELDAALTAFGP